MLDKFKLKNKIQNNRILSVTIICSSMYLFWIYFYDFTHMMSHGHHSVQCI